MVVNPLSPRPRPETRVSFHRMLNDRQADSYAFLLLPKAVSLSLAFELAQKAIPAGAIILAVGVGEPDERTLFNMERYFGYRTAAPQRAAA